MANCPKEIGPGGKNCKKCLEDVDLEKTIVFYSERSPDFTFDKKVLRTKCCRGKL